MLDFAFEPGFGYEAYVDWALDVPLYFVKRGDTYHDVAGASFRDLLAGRLAALPGERAVISDWANHLGTLFPEVRLKRYLEMRGADAGPRDRLAALPAFWVGLLYDPVALDQAWQLVRGWNAADRQALRDAVPRDGLDALVSGRTVRDVARDVLAIAETGLRHRARRDAAGRDERVHLAPLRGIIDSGLTLADDLIARFEGPWGRSVRPVFSELAL
jgi:glutamate--cysteine ligase